MISTPDSLSCTCQHSILLLAKFNKDHTDRIDFEHSEQYYHCTLTNENDDHEWVKEIPQNW